jgi:hypothetical protein
MKDARGKGHEAVLKEDRLYIDKRRFYPRPVVSSFNHPPLPPPPPYPLYKLTFTLDKGETIFQFVFINYYYTT